MVTPWGFESPLSHQKGRVPYGVLFFFGAREGRTRKDVKKTCQWHVFSPWESPFPFQTRPVGVGMKWKRLVSAYPIRDTPFLYSRQRGLENRNETVRWTVAIRRFRRMLLSVTSPLSRTKKEGVVSLRAPMGQNSQNIPCHCEPVTDVTGSQSPG